MAVSSISFKVDVDITGVKKAMVEVSGATKGMAKPMSSALGAMAQKLQGLNTPVSKMSSGFGTLAKKVVQFTTVGLALKAVNAAVSGVAGSVQEALAASDGMDKFAQTMQFAGIQGKELSKAEKAVKSYADNTVYNLNDVANTTAQLASNGVKDYVGLTQAAGNLNAVAGGNADTFKSVAMVLTQTAGAGRLTTENWNQLSDAIPGAAGPLMDAMKKAGAYTGNFRDAMAAGQITADEFNSALMGLGMSDVAKEAATSTKTFEGAFGALKANVVDGINKIIDSFGKGNLVGLINGFSGGVTKAFDVVAQAIPKVIDAFQQLWDSFKDTATFDTISSIISSIIDTLKSISIDDVISGFQTFFDVLKAATPIIAGFVGAVLTIKALITMVTIINSVTSAIAFMASPVGLVVVAVGALIAIGVALWQNWGAISAGLTAIWQAIKDAASAAWNAIKGAILTAWNAIKAGVSTTVSAISSVISATWNSIKSVSSSVWNGIKSVISTVWNAIKSAISAAINAVKSVVSSVWNSIKSVTSSVWNGIKSVISGVWNGIKSGVTTAVNSVKSKVTGVWNGIKSTTSSVWNGIKSTISNAINGAKDIVSNVIDSIKRMFNIKLKFPSIEMPPMPHLDLKWSSKTFFGKRISYPSGFDVGWHANGGIFTGPSVIGVGEAGDEAVVPLSNKSKMKPFASAVAGMIDRDNDGNSGGNTKEQPFIVHTHVILNDREIARAITPEITKRQKLATISELRRNGKRGF